tara:strand:+ start:863 stop:1513 length:651 start_codon:yes stop_codon:yes gene_type:complete
MPLDDKDFELTKTIISAKISTDVGWRPIQLASMSLKYPGSKEYKKDLVKNYVDAILKLWSEVSAGVDSGDFSSKFVGKLPGFELLQAAVEFTQLTVDILKSPITLKIKTVPMYHLSYSNLLFKPVVVYINSNDMIAPFNQDEIDNPYNRVMSGMYIMTGFKHVITSTRAYSQFVLIRDPFEFAPYLFESVSETLSAVTMNLPETQGATDFSINNLA